MFIYRCETKDPKNHKEGRVTDLLNGISRVAMDLGVLCESIRRSQEASRVSPKLLQGERTSALDCYQRYTGIPRRIMWVFAVETWLAVRSAGLE